MGVLPEIARGSGSTKRHGVQADHSQRKIAAPAWKRFCSVLVAKVSGTVRFEHVIQSLTEMAQADGTNKRHGVVSGAVRFEIE